MYVKVTLENFSDFSIGSKVEFNFGAYYPLQSGVITGYKITPATKHSDVSIFILVEYVDIETGEVVETTVSRFDETGIGCRIVELCDKISKNKSPWSV
jgi:hypothetical protein